jgi:MEMO1 family protein
LNLFEGKRQSAAAGLFYPDDKDELYELIHRSFTSDIGPGSFPTKPSGEKAGTRKRVECLIVPHAGYVYSGPVAAHSYLKAFEFLSGSESDSITVVIFGPNHYGLGSGVALSPSKEWSTPLGEVPVDESLSLEISKKSDVVDFDSLAHSREHSIEVQVPFLQVISRLAGKKISIVPICLMMQDRETSEQVSSSVLRLIEKRADGSTLVLGSSDLTHYEPHTKASSKDAKLLEAVSTLNTLEFYKILERLNVTACGYGAISSLMNISRGLGYERGTVLKYATSGDVTGDKSSVVGYSSVQFS